jgi:uncharacterized protein (DUF3084 family)
VKAILSNAQKPEPIEEQIKRMHTELKQLSNKTGINMKELTSIIANRELLISNKKLQMIHEHLDWIEQRATEHKDLHNQTPQPKSRNSEIENRKGAT